MKTLPDTTGALLFTMLGAGCFLFSAFVHIPMLQVVLGFKHVAPGGGEFMIGFLFGLPLLILSVIALGIVTFHRSWRSMAGTIVFGLASASLMAWLIAIAIG